MSVRPCLWEPSEILDWVVTAVAPVWVNTVCGDGACDAPFEFPAYGRFGCRADCGVERSLSTIMLNVRANFMDDTYSPSALTSAASWNMCRRDEEAHKAGYADRCWFEEDKTFRAAIQKHIETVQVPKDSLWYVHIKGDYMGRVKGNVFVVEGSELPWVGTVPEWRSCPRVVAPSARRSVGTAEASGRRLLAAVDEHGALLRRAAEDGDDVGVGVGPAGGGLRAHHQLHARIMTHKRLVPFVPGEVKEEEEEEEEEEKEEDEEEGEEGEEEVSPYDHGPCFQLNVSCFVPDYLKPLRFSF